MKTIDNTVNYTSPFFIEEYELPTAKEGVTLEQAYVDDADVIEFTQEHAKEVADSEIDVTIVSQLSPKEAMVYKILEGEDYDQELIGLIYLIRKGMETGSLEIAYLLDESYQSQGIGKASVGALTEVIGKKFDLIAKIDPENDRSVRLVKGLGFFSTQDVVARDFEPFYRPKDRKRISEIDTAA